MITTHVLNTAEGRPGRGIAVDLERADGEHWHKVGSGTTDDDGRCKTLTPPGPVQPGGYRLTFHTADASSFFPVVQIAFVVADGAQHYHVPLLLSPYGYSTYRGS